MLVDARVSGDRRMCPGSGDRPEPGSGPGCCRRGVAGGAPGSDRRSLRGPGRSTTRPRGRVARLPTTRSARRRRTAGSWSRWPVRRAFQLQARTLRAALGRGYVELLRYDEARRALLKRSAGRSSKRLATAEQIAILCAMLRLAWEVPRDEAAGEPVDAAASLHRDHLVAAPARRSVPTAGRRPGVGLRRAAVGGIRRGPLRRRPRRSRARERPGERPRRFGLRVRRTGRLRRLSRPDDLGVGSATGAPSRSRRRPRMLARHHCRLLADHSGMDAEAIWEWGSRTRVDGPLPALAPRRGRRPARPATAPLLMDRRRSFARPAIRRPRDRSAGLLRRPPLLVGRTLLRRAAPRRRRAARAGPARRRTGARGR